MNNAIPDFDGLNTVEGMPVGCAWGVFDCGGKKDTLGCLNLLSPEVVREAYSEARDGISISLNHRQDLVKMPTRRGYLTHRVLSWSEDIAPGSNSQIHALDDEIQMNTQISSQWDSLYHYAHQSSGLGYNGVVVNKETAEKAVKGELESLGLESWHSRGGLVGRGVLLDYRAFATAHNIRYDPFARHVITVDVLEKIALFQGTELKFGDILIVRTGFAEDLQVLNAECQLKKMVEGGGGMIGIEGTPGAAKWFWNRHFAAVASDTFIFEAFPPMMPDGSFGSHKDLVLYSYFLALFGMSIGELWDVKALGEHCAKIGRYSFLLTSIPMNITGLIGSPPNALALF